MIESQKFVNVLINIFVGSLIIYWLYYGFFFTPLMIMEINLFQNYSFISTSENWDMGTKLMVIFGYLFLDLCFILLYYYILIPLFIIFYSTYIKIEAENKRIEYLKIHFIHIVVTLLFAYLLFESNNKFNNHVEL